MEVSIEFNVTKAGDYDISAYGFQTDGAKSIGAGNLQQIIDAEVGVHIASIRFDGPTIYSSSLNPANVTSISISSSLREYGQEIKGIPHSHKYLYTEFDKPQVAVGD